METVTVMPADADVPRGPSRLIARQLALGFGLVSLVAIVMCGLLLAIVGEVAGFVLQMQGEEAGIRQSTALALEVREQYAHIAHTIVEGDRSHLGHYRTALRRVQDGIRALEPLAPASARPRLAALTRLSTEIDGLFRSELLPAVLRGDDARIREDHRRVLSLATSAAEEADELARHLESRMSHAHVLATNAARRGQIVGALCVLLVLSLSVWSTLRLRAAVLRPLRALTAAARRFGSGDFATRVGSIGRGELEEVAVAFDRMAEEVSIRERRIVEGERMAAIGQLAAGVAHEMNNPIGVIRGYLKTMSPEADPETLRDELQILDEEAAYCQRIAEDLLAYARTPELRLEPLSMPDFLEESLRRLRGMPKITGAKIELSARPGNVLADATRLRQLLANLVLNAVQVTPDGEAVEVEGTMRADGYELRVLDRGPGISEQDRGRVFEPFYSTTSGGSGLGLAVSLGIVRAHGGSIAPEARTGGGTLFRVVLPAGGPVVNEGEAE